MKKKGGKGGKEIRKEGTGEWEQVADSKRNSKGDKMIGDKKN